MHFVTSSFLSSKFLGSQLQRHRSPTKPTPWCADALRTLQNAGGRRPDRCSSTQRPRASHAHAAHERDIARCRGQLDGLEAAWVPWIWIPRKNKPLAFGASRWFRVIFANPSHEALKRGSIIPGRMLEYGKCSFQTPPQLCERPT